MLFARISVNDHMTSFTLSLFCFLVVCVYGHEDCRGRENCEPLDGSFGECRCNRFLGFTGSSCDEPTAATYMLIAMVALIVASSVAAVVVRNMLNRLLLHLCNV